MSSNDSSNQTPGGGNTAVPLSSLSALAAAHAAAQAAAAANGPQSRRPSVVVATPLPNNDIMMQLLGAVQDIQKRITIIETDRALPSPTTITTSGGAATSSAEHSSLLDSLRSTTTTTSSKNDERKSITIKPSTTSTSGSGERKYVAAAPATPRPSRRHDDMMSSDDDGDGNNSNGSDVEIDGKGEQNPKVERKVDPMADVGIDGSQDAMTAKQHESSLQQLQSIAINMCEHVDEEYNGSFIDWHKNGVVKWKDQFKREAKFICEVIDSLREEWIKCSKSEVMEILCRRLGALISLNKGRGSDVANIIENRKRTSMIPINIEMSAIKQANMEAKINKSSSSSSSNFSSTSTSNGKQKKNKKKSKNSSKGKSSGGAGGPPFPPKRSGNGGAAGKAK